MAIITIGRIQHRHGLQEDIPNLATAELGWSLDQRRLFIGNGSVEEGAPVVGRTEILTQYSDLTGLFNGYIYKGKAAGYIAQTGASPINPITQSIQDKLDDVCVSVRDFGVAGNGETDDTAAINRALSELFCRSMSAASRRTLYFPAGVYVISEALRIPAYASIRGDGKNRTIIVQRNPYAVGVVALADGRQQIEANMGHNGAALPRNISISSMTLNNLTYGRVMSVHCASFCMFTDVGFDGRRFDPALDPSIDPRSVDPFMNTCLTITSTPAAISNNIMFDKCEFIDGAYPMVLNDNMQNITFNMCTFDKFYNGCMVGALPGGRSRGAPSAIRFIGGHYDHIGLSAIVVGEHAKNVTTAFNHFAEVGNNNMGNGYAIAPVIEFNSPGHICTGDTFDRSDRDEQSFPRIRHSSHAVMVQYYNEQHYGLLRQRVGARAEIANDVITETALPIVFSPQQPTCTIEYTISRGASVQIGSIQVTQAGGECNLSEEYTEQLSNGIEVGITFSTIIDPTTGEYALAYTSSNTGLPALFDYAIRYFDHRQ
ncbi:Pectate lyase superfamily protein [uncultured Caudovirales phage]|uniref:Pectate lyase superfamily protein n=1 Tax=uncultured Caudovirales phage TaxID=2100421 RepID=A0A6J5L4L3_9CAUD|nr:Pectate lyase superfamily protein [uncultured Caudovirales phage]